MDLRTYCAHRRITDEHLAGILGVSRPYITKLRNGRSVTLAQLAVDISIATGGLVSIQEALFPDGVPAGATMTPADVPADPAFPHSASHATPEEGSCAPTP